MPQAEHSLYIPEAWFPCHTEPLSSLLCVFQWLPCPHPPSLKTQPTVETEGASTWTWTKGCSIQIMGLINFSTNEKVLLQFGIVGGKLFNIKRMEHSWNLIGFKLLNSSLQNRFCFPPVKMTNLPSSLIVVSFSLQGQDS